MQITLTDRLVARTANEGQAVSFIAKVYDDSAEPWTLSTPTTVQYRVDDPESGSVILDWTSASASSSQTITVTGAQNALSTCGSRARRQLTVRVNAGLSTVAVATREWCIRSLVGVAA